MFHYLNARIMALILPVAMSMTLTMTAFANDKRYDVNPLQGGYMPPIIEAENAEQDDAAAASLPLIQQPPFALHLASTATANRDISLPRCQCPEDRRPRR